MNRFTIYLVGIVLLGTGIRLLLATDPGDPKDLPINIEWMQNAAEVGVVQAYGTKSPIHGPIQVGLFEISGKFRNILFGKEPLQNQAINNVFAKLPMITADASIIIILYVLLRKKFGSHAGIIGSAIYALNPASLVVTGIWGQTDSIYTAFVLATILALANRKWLIVGMLSCGAFLCKPTSAIILLPLIFSLSCTHFDRLIRTLSGALLLLLPISVAFALQGKILTLQQYLSLSYSQFPFENKTALNATWLLQEFNNHSLPTLPFGIEYRLIGICISLSLIVYVLWRSKILFRNGEGIAPLAAVSQFTLFMFLVGMRSRYNFPFLALAIPICFFSAEGTLIYLLVSVLMFINLISKISNAVSGSIFVKPVLSAISVFQINNLVIAILQCILYIWFISFLIRMAILQKKTDGEKENIHSMWDYLSRYLLIFISPESPSEGAMINSLDKKTEVGS